MDKNYLVEVDGKDLISDGTIGDALKKIICVYPKQRCADCCVVGEKCLYWVTFIEKKTFGVHIYPNTDNANNKYYLALSGRANEFFHYFIYAIDKIARVKRAEEINTVLVYDGGKKEFSPTSEAREKEREEKIQKLFLDLNQKERDISSFKYQLQKYAEISDATICELCEVRIALAKLKLAARKSITGIIETKNIFKHRKFANIRKDLEMAVK